MREFDKILGRFPGRYVVVDVLCEDPDGAGPDELVLIGDFATAEEAFRAAYRGKGAPFVGYSPRPDERAAAVV